MNRITDRLLPWGTPICGFGLESMLFVWKFSVIRLATCFSFVATIDVWYENEAKVVLL